MGVSLSPWKGRASRVKQPQLQPILMARPLAFNRVGRAEGNGLEKWGIGRIREFGERMGVQLDLLSRGSLIYCSLVFPGQGQKGERGSRCHRRRSVEGVKDFSSF